MPEILLDYYYVIYPLVLSAVLIFPLEYFFGAKKNTLKSRLFNLTYFITFIPLWMHLNGAIIGWLNSVIAPRPHYLINFSAADLPFPKFFFLIVVLLFNDLIQYAYHRLRHKVGWLWQTHKFHHSETELNATTSQRHHFLEGLFKAALFTTPINCLLAIHYVGPEDQSTFTNLVSLIIGYWGYFTHANLRLGFGPLNIIFTSPQYHRIHHSIRPEHQNKNYALFFPILDYIFGSYYRPRAGEFPATGVNNYIEKSILNAHLEPFLRWRK